MHPAQQAHVSRQQERRDVEDRQRSLTEKVVKRYNLRFVHVRRRNGMDEVMPKGGCTVAYALPARRGGRIIEVACSLVHDNDSYCKRTGRYYAATKFELNQTIQLRVPRNVTPPLFIKRMFGVMVNG